MAEYIDLEVKYLVKVFKDNSSFGSELIKGKSKAIDLMLSSDIFKLYSSELIFYAPI